MNLEIYDCEQGSPEWFACRLGIPTASEFATVMASGRGGGESKTRRKYLLTLIGERLTGQIAPGFSNDHMERGKVMEDEARDLYAMVAEVEPQRIGFMRRGDAGASPDSLVGDKGLLEIKTKLPHLQLECLLDEKLPAEHAKQIQGQLWISGREWCDLVCYWPALPPFIKRVERDERAIAEIKIAVEDFNAELQALMGQLEKYRRAA
jgi:hypothetical protein